MSESAQPEVRAAHPISGTPRRQPSLEIAFNLAMQQMDAQERRFSNLDTKASFVLGSASILTTAATGLHTASASVKAPSGVTAFLLALLPILAAAAYVCVVGAAFLAYKLRAFQWFPTVTSLNDYFTTKEEDYTRGTMIASWKVVYENNEKVIQGSWGKATWTKVALASLLVEAAIVALLTIVQSTLPSASPAK